MLNNGATDNDRILQQVFIDRCGILTATHEIVEINGKHFIQVRDNIDSTQTTSNAYLKPIFY